MPGHCLRMRAHASTTSTVILYCGARQPNEIAGLRKQGAGDAQVPPQWEGVQLSTEIGPAVAANYPDDVHILQMTPIELSSCWIREVTLDGTRCSLRDALMIPPSSMTALNISRSVKFMTATIEV